MTAKAKIRRRLHRENGGRCHYCGEWTWLKGVNKTRDLDHMATLDHVCAQSRGGAKSAVHNMVLSCFRCNSLKRSYDYSVFITWVKKDMTEWDWVVARRKARKYQKIHDSNMKFRSVLYYRGIRAYC